MMVLSTIGANLPGELVGTAPHAKFWLLRTEQDPGENIIDDDNIQLSTLEKNAILRVIEKHNGNITRAAKELGLTRTALYRRLSKYDI